jgi:hypothetical protein
VNESVAKRDNIEAFVLGLFLYVGNVAASIMLGGRLSGSTHMAFVQADNDAGLLGAFLCHLD